MEDQLRVTVEAILAEARVRRRQESISCDRSEGGLEGGGVWAEMSRVVTGGIVMLGRRQVTPR